MLPIPLAARFGKSTIGADGNAGKPTLLAQSPLLEGADGLDFDRSGKLWVAVNERKCASHRYRPTARSKRSPRTAAKVRWNFPPPSCLSATQLTSSNNDTPRGDNLDANGATARDGIGASIAQITP